MYLPLKESMVEKTFQRFSDVQRYMDITNCTNSAKHGCLDIQKFTNLQCLKTNSQIIRQPKYHTNVLSNNFNLNKKERVNQSTKTHSLFQVSNRERAT